MIFFSDNVNFKSEYANPNFAICLPDHNITKINNYQIIMDKLIIETINEKIWSKSLTGVVFRCSPFRHVSRHKQIFFFFGKIISSTFIITRL